MNVASLAIGLVTLLMSGIAVAESEGSRECEHRPRERHDFYLNPSYTDTLPWLPQAPANHRIVYDASNFLSYGDLRIPRGHPPRGGWPVIVYLHGGGWTVDVSLDYVARLVETLTAEGIATWSLEFRRIGSAGGGWPNTFLDVAKGTDYLRNIAATYHLNLNRVIVMGHSSGGHLALWLAARHKLPPIADLYTANPLPIIGVVSQAGLPDLEGALAAGRTDVYAILGTTDPDILAQRFAEASPVDLLPLGIPQSLIVGTLDNDWRISTTESYTAAAQAAGDDAQLTLLDGANHFDNVDADGPAWRPTLRAALLRLGIRR